jgi:eukaryotic-like serine/threonine-protein kinase
VSPEAPPAPARFGKYEIQRTLGAGAMGVVYLAHDPAIDRQVALKTIQKDLLGGKQAATTIARFRQEAVAAGRLSHPGIVAVYDYGEDESTAYIVMEYVPGHDLEAYLAGRTPTLPEAAAMMSQLLDALQCAHDAGVVHRDIKPSNVLVHGRLKITDFGIARLESSKLTHQGTAIGTPHYMAPEQYAGVATDHRVDLFASGVLFYEMLTGALPFDGATIQEIAYKICHVEPAPPTTLRPALPRAVDVIVSKALAKAKEDRFGSARDLAAAIAGALSADAPDRTRRAPDRSAPLPPGAPTGATIGERLRAYTREDLDRVTQVLAGFVGPIAKIFVQKAAADVKSHHELCVRLSERLSTAAERERFLKQVGG